MSLWRKWVCPFYNRKKNIYNDGRYKLVRNTEMEKQLNQGNCKGIYLLYGEEGLLLISGKHVFKGYYKNEELTNQSKMTIDGKEYYNTGTLGYIDEDGYFTPTGRNSRFYIMSSLNKVYCDNVQSIISSFDCVRDCAVVKVPDQEELYVNKAYIVLNDGYFPDEDTLGRIKNLFYIPTTVSNGRKTQLKTYEIPSYVEFVDSLPRIPGSEKIDYQSLEKDAELKLTTGNKVKVK